MIRASIYGPTLDYRQDILGGYISPEGIQYGLHTQGGARVVFPYDAEVGRVGNGCHAVLWVQDMEPWPGTVVACRRVVGEALEYDLVPMATWLDKRVAAPPARNATIGEIIKDLQDAANGRVATPIRDFRVDTLATAQKVIDLKGLSASTGCTVADVLNYICRDYKMVWCVRWMGAVEVGSDWGVMDLRADTAATPVATLTYQDMADAPEIVESIQDTINSLVIVTQGSSVFGRPRVVAEDTESMGDYGLLAGTISAAGLKTEAEAKDLLSQFSGAKTTIALAIKRASASGLYPGETVRLVLDEGMDYLFTIRGMDLAGDAGSVILAGDTYVEGAA